MNKKEQLDYAKRCAAYSDKYETYASCLDCNWSGPASKLGDCDECPNCKNTSRMVGFMAERKPK